jgi:hypothetical protein
VHSTQEKAARLGDRDIKPWMIEGYRVFGLGQGPWDGQEAIPQLEVARCITS